MPPDVRGWRDKMKTKALASVQVSAGPVFDGNGIAIPAAKNQGNFVLGFLLILNFFLLPIYIFESGGFQLVDITLFITIIVVLLWKNLPVIDKKLIYSLLPFTIWVFLIDFIYYLIYKNTTEILSFIAIVYGLVQLYVFSLIFNKILHKHGLKFIYIALIFSILGCFLTKGYSEEGRGSLSFNNPNQLAYFAIILLAYVIMLNQYRTDKNIESKYFILIDMLIILIANFMTIIALSRVGVVVTVMLDICLLSNVKNFKYFIVTTMGLAVITLLFLLTQHELIEQKLSTRGKENFTAHSMTHDDSFEARLIKPLQHLKGLSFLYGIGPGGAGRALKQPGIIVMKYSTMEVHSSFGDVLRSYGLIGLFLFSYWYFRFVWQSRLIKNGWWVMAAIFAFNNVHNGIRFRSFWIFMGLMVVMISFAELNRKNKEVSKLSVNNSKK